MSPGYREKFKIQQQKQPAGGNKRTIPPFPSPSLTRLKHEFHPNIQDMLQIIHKTSCHSKYAIFSSMKLYALIEWMQTDACLAVVTSFNY